MKAITVQVGDVRLMVGDSGTFSMMAGYGGQIKTQMSDDIRQALIAFTSLLIESEE